MKLTTALLLLISVITLTGCSTAAKVKEAPIEYQPEYSFAKNILYASGMPGVQMMQDAVITQQQFDSFQNSSSALSSMSSAAALGGAASLLQTGSLFASGDLLKFSGIGLVNGLLAPKHAMFRGHLAIWMPKEMAETQDEMKQKLIDIFKQAHLNSIPEGFTLKVLPRELDGKKVFDRFHATGGICDETFNKNRATCSGSLKGAITTMEALLDNKYQPGFRPTFLDNPGAPAWVAYVNQTIDINGIYCSTYPKKDATDDELAACKTYNQAYLANLKKNLPDWIYTYSFDYQKRLGILEQATTGTLYPLIVAEQPKR